MKHLLLIFLSLIIISCGAKPTSTKPGTCSLDCSKAIIASNNFKIEKISADAQWYCGGYVGEFPSPVTLKYAIYEVDKYDEKIKYPKPSISVDIKIGGGLSSNPEKIPAENFPNYIGIATPKSKFCSDSCGVVTFDIYPLCYANSKNLILIQLFSGSLASDSYQMTINSDSGS